MKESDWKIFKDIKDKALNSYCLGVLEDSKKIISNERNTAHERYIMLYKLIDRKDETIAQFFNGHSRSKAWSQLFAIRKEGIADKNLLSKLSEDFLESTDPNRFN